MHSVRGCALGLGNDRAGLPATRIKQHKRTACEDVWPDDNDDADEHKPERPLLSCEHSRQRDPAEATRNTADDEEAGQAPVSWGFRF
jgi:hypothetical protein